MLSHCKSLLERNEDLAFRLGKVCRDLKRESLYIHEGSRPGEFSILYSWGCRVRVGKIEQLGLRKVGAWRLRPADGEALPLPRGGGAAKLSLGFGMGILGTRPNQ